MWFNYLNQLVGDSTYLEGKYYSLRKPSEKQPNPNQNKPKKTKKKQKKQKNTEHTRLN